MERELASKVFILEDYISKDNMEQHIKEYIKKLKENYPDSIVTREFYKEKGILVRATQTQFNVPIQKDSLEKESELEQEEVRIKEKGINGLGENVYIEKNHSKTREKELGHSGTERERGSR